MFFEVDTTFEDIKKGSDSGTFQAGTKDDAMEIRAEDSFDDKKRGQCGTIPLAGKPSSGAGLRNQRKVFGATILLCHEKRLSGIRRKSSGPQEGFWYLQRAFGTRSFSRRLSRGLPPQKAQIHLGRGQPNH
ncbi:uncharacterized protein LOC143040892 [Oratosquilla oratoria]|uniref:uncharacterized protein LOC143040892 n=1 Tax=Oratosquilla oratoria TaxID=337810 RepID=UPI003F75DF89